MWYSFEIRWRNLVLDAVLPGVAGSENTSERGTEYIDAVCGDVILHAGIGLRFGFRAAVWLIIFLPIFAPKYFCPLFCLTTQQREHFVRSMHQSEWYVARQLVETVKLIACFAHLERPSVRAALGQ